MTNGPSTNVRWFLQRFALAAFVVVGVTALTFVLIHVAPGDPIYALAGDGGTPEYYADMRTKYGLDRPIVEQFGRYAKAVAVADFGYSFMYQAPVARARPARARLIAAGLQRAAGGDLFRIHDRHCGGRAPERTL